MDGDIMEARPKKDGSGRGVRANRGRGSCSPPQDKGEEWVNPYGKKIWGKTNVR